MLNELKQVIERATPGLPGDLAGGVALVVLLIAGLHLPGMF